MLLIGVAILFVVLGLAILAAIPKARRVGTWLLPGVAIFFVAIGLLWVTTFLLPQVASSFAAGVGLFILTFVHTRQGARLPLFPQMMAVVLALVTFHISLSLFDLAVSTRPFESDRELVSAALENGASVPSLISAAALLALLLVSVGIGHYLGMHLSERES